MAKKKAKKEDFTGGDHSFKNWLRLMFENNYLLLFVVFLAATIVSAFFPSVLGMMPDENWNWFFVGFFGLILLIVVYKGFYQKWDYLKKGKSR